MTSDENPYQKVLTDAPSQRPPNESIYLEEFVLSPWENIRYNLGMGAWLLIFGIMATFILVFGTSMLGLPARFVGTAYSGTYLVFTVFAPIFGALSDRTKLGKLGRRKPYIIIGAPLLALSYLWVWFTPPALVYSEYDPTSGLLFLASLFMFRFTEAICLQPYFAMSTEISREEGNRVDLAAVGMLIAYAGQFISTMVPTIFIADLGDVDRSSDYLWILNPSGLGQAIYHKILVFAIIAAVIFVAIMVMVALTTKIPQIQPKESGKQSFNLIHILAEPLKDLNGRRFLLGNTLLSFGPMVLSFSLFNFAMYVLDLSGAWMTLYIGIYYGGIVGGYFFWFWLSKRIKIKSAFLFTVEMMAASTLLILILFIPFSPLIKKIVGLALIGFMQFSNQGVNIFSNPMMSDVIDQAETKTQKSLAGNYSGAASFLFSGFSAVGMWGLSLLIDFFGVEKPKGYLVMFGIAGVIMVFCIRLLLHVKIVGKTLPSS